MLAPQEIATMSSEVRARQAQFGMIDSQTAATRVERRGARLSGRGLELETEWADSFVNENSGKQFIEPDRLKNSFARRAAARMMMIERARRSI
jgi:hypothetical protein